MTPGPQIITSSPESILAAMGSDWQNESTKEQKDSVGLKAHIRE